MKDLAKTQQQILRHHGGDGAFARERITETYQRRHDETFWQYWDEKVAKNYQVGEGVLDMGAGIGQFVEDCAKRYPDSPVYGIEAAPYRLENPLPLPANAKILTDDLNNPQADIADNSLAMVMANRVVHELTQPIKMFRAAYQWLKPGGRLCIIDLVRQPLADYLQRRYEGTALWAGDTTVADLEEAFEHFLEHNRYHADDIAFMLTAGGFKVVEKSLERNGRFAWIVVEK